MSRLFSKFSGRLLVMSALGLAGGGFALVMLPEHKSAEMIQLAPAAAARTDDLDSIPRRTAWRRLQAELKTAESDTLRWLRDTPARDEFLAEKPGNLLSLRMEHRLQGVQKEFAAFLKRHPRRQLAAAMMNFINRSAERLSAIKEWEQARVDFPEDPACWTELGHFFAHNGPALAALDCYTKAASLTPLDDVETRHTLADALILFRKEATEFYGCPEKDVFDRALLIYRQTLALRPASLELAMRFAETYYLIKPARINDALAAWENALKLAATDRERENIFLHLARCETEAGRFVAARRHLQDVSLPLYEELKAQILHHLRQREAQSLPPQT